MTCYCPDCGFKNEYSANKPKFCQNCGESMQPKAVAKIEPKVARKPSREVEPEIEEEDIGFELDPNSIKVEAESRFMTFEDLKKAGPVARGGIDPDLAATRQEVIDNMLKGQTVKKNPISEAPRSSARRVGKLKR